MSTSHPQIAGSPEDAGESPPFWVAKTLEQMTPSEWESLCDGCGQCCLLKVEDEDTGKVFLTELACKLLDLRSCRCRDYAGRRAKVPDCVAFNPDNVRKIAWLPESCAYRRVAQGRGLEWWHPLVSGDPATVHHAGISVRGWVRSEKSVRPGDIARFIIGEAT